jgi:hypothetical protein
MIDSIWEEILDALNNKRWEKGDNKNQVGIPSIGERERRSIKNCVVVFQECFY